MPHINARSRPDGGSTTYSFSHPIDLDIYLKLRISAVGFENAVIAASDAGLMKALVTANLRPAAHDRDSRALRSTAVPFICERNILISRKLRIE
jgi:hypothetical protein